jgi:RNA polymerase sigma-70 factor (ECF subfamily)
MVVRAVGDAGLLPGGADPVTLPADVPSGTVGAPTADEELVRRLYAEHGAALLGYARLLLGGDVARAQDVVQETLLRAWRNPEALAKAREAGRSPRGWLLTVTRNLVIDDARARSSRPRVVADLDEVDPSSEDRRLDDVLTSYEVADALQSLSVDHRAVIVALYYEDRSVADAAQHLGVPPGTVKSRAFYALRALRVACEERGVLP